MPRKRRQQKKKKSLQSTMSGTDQCQTHPEQQESATINEKKDYWYEEGLGVPIIRAKQYGFTCRSRTVFLTMEDLEFMRNPYEPNSMLYVDQEIYYISPDVKAQQHQVADAEREHPTGVVDALVHNYPDPISKKDWIEESRKRWDLSSDNRIRSGLKSEKGLLPLSFYICGISGKGCAAILRDSQDVPVVARSKCLSDDHTKSTFYSRLNGVALAVKIALDYKVSQFTIYVPSFKLSNFTGSIWSPNESGSSNYLRKTHLRADLRPEDKCDIEKIYFLTTNIRSDLDQLQRQTGNVFFRAQSVFSFDNKAAEFLANLSSDQDMKFSDICDNEILSQIVYEDAIH